MSEKLYIDGEEYDVPEGTTPKDHLTDLIQKDEARLLRWCDKYIQTSDLPEDKHLVVGIRYSRSITKEDCT
jgi:hypothetical protein